MTKLICFTAILLSGCLPELDTYYSQFKIDDRLTIDLIAVDENTVMDPCFVENLSAYADEYYRRIGRNPPKTRLFVYVVHNPDAKIAGRFEPPSRAHMIDEWHPLGIFGHELTRFTCWHTGECVWNQDPYDWSGLVGEWWNIGETLAVEMCGSAAPVSHKIVW